MDNRQVKIKKSGFVLLFTLMVLVILVAVIVQFQSDTALQVRASNYRLNQLQCRYAAESALVAASQIIIDAQRKAREKARQEQNISQAPAENQPPTSDPCALAMDPCSLAATDPCSLEETPPNDNEDQTASPPSLFLKKTMQIGEATVEIEIYDENSKFPLYWLVHSPIWKNRTPIEKALKHLGEILQADSEAAARMIILTNSVSRPLNVPEPPRYFFGPTTSYSSSRRRSSGSSGASLRYRSPRGKALTRSQYMQREEDIYQAMAVFASRLEQKIRDDKQLYYLREALPDRPGSFLDYLGAWGHSKININTAPEEVMEAAFQPLGCTPEMARAIQKYREQKPFTNTAFLSRVTEINRSTLSKIRSIITVNSDTFTVHIKARLGRSRYSLISGIHKNTNNQFVNYAVFPGD